MIYTALSGIYLTNTTKLVNKYIKPIYRKVTNYESSKRSKTEKYASTEKRNSIKTIPNLNSHVAGTDTATTDGDKRRT